MSRKVAGRESLEFYLALRYRIALFPEEEGGFTVTIPDLPGCIAQGEDAAEALEAIEKARRDWIEVAYEDEDEIPLPAEDRKYSGRVLVRMPQALHRNLSEAAGMEGVSLNQYICNALSGSHSNWRLQRELQSMRREIRSVTESYRPSRPAAGHWISPTSLIPKAIPNKQAA